jgi:hydrogenase maturation factor HypF (carbamoyltransferase family)
MQQMELEMLDRIEAFYQSISRKHGDKCPRCGGRIVTMVPWDATAPFMHSWLECERCETVYSKEQN